MIRARNDAAEGVQFLRDRIDNIKGIRNFLAGWMDRIPIVGAGLASAVRSALGYITDYYAQVADMLGDQITWQDGDWTVRNVDSFFNELIPAVIGLAIVLTTSALLAAVFHDVLSGWQWLVRLGVAVEGTIAFLATLAVAAWWPVSILQEVWFEED